MAGTRQESRRSEQAVAEFAATRRVLDAIDVPDVGDPLRRVRSRSAMRSRGASRERSRYRSFGPRVGALGSGTSMHYATRQAAVVGSSVAQAGLPLSSVSRTSTTMVPPGCAWSRTTSGQIDEAPARSTLNVGASDVEARQGLSDGALEGPAR